MGTSDKYRKMCEESLVTAAAGGDGKAFSVLMERCDLKLRSVLSKYPLGEEMDDVIQESYRKVFVSLSSFDSSKSAFVTWLSTIASHTALDHLRSRAVRDVSTLATNESGELIQPQAMVNSPEDTLIFNQSYEEAVERIHSLPDAYRTIAELRFLDELPYEEIASKLGLPLNTVRTRIRRAKEMVKCL